MIQRPFVSLLSPLGLCGLGLLAACSSDVGVAAPADAGTDLGAPLGDSAGPADAAKIDVALSDVQDKDPGPAVDEATPDDATIGDDSMTDADLGGSPEESCDFENPKAGHCGFSCQTGADCLSNFCVPSALGTVCTRTCVSDCPEGWQCLPVAMQPDVVFACVATAPNVGRPCTSDTECLSTVGVAVAGLGGRCVSHGEDGSFCGKECAKDPYCPKGFTCSQVPLPGGTTGKQCVPDDVSKVCSPLFVAYAASTTCAVTNANGSCKGTRTCTSNGLSACNASTPVVESCNGLDDNCNGKIDESLPATACYITNEYGSCKGAELCKDGTPICTGKEPSGEVCDGVDNDCNGKIDEGCDDDKDGY